jgi:hypothetical protein
MSRPFLASAETKISAGVSRVTGAAELIEMGQYRWFTFFLFSRL